MSKAPLPPDERLVLAWNALDIADRMSVRAFQAGVRVSVKADGSPVTDLDTAIERLITERIRASFPTDSVLGEEFGGSSAAEDRRWIIDPIDGTANFVESVPIYAHMIAYQRQGHTVFSVVSAPGLHKRWWAYRDLGAFEGNDRIGVSKAATLGQAKIAYGGLRDYPLWTEGMLRLIVECRRSRGFGNFLPHMLVAEGIYDLASSGEGCNLWDVAPLDLIVTEAGGRLTCLDGLAWREPQPILTSNGALHRAAVYTLAGPGRSTSPVFA